MGEGPERGKVKIGELILFRLSMFVEISFSKGCKLAQRVAFLRKTVKATVVTLRVVFETQLAPAQSAPRSRRYINGLSAPDAHAYGAI